MYKLRIYKLSGVDKGNLDHEELLILKIKWTKDTMNCSKGFVWLKSDCMGTEKRWMEAIGGILICLNI